MHPSQAARLNLRVEASCMMDKRKSAVVSPLVVPDKISRWQDIDAGALRELSIEVHVLVWQGGFKPIEALGYQMVGHPHTVIEGILVLHIKAQ